MLESNISDSGKFEILKSHADNLKHTQRLFRYFNIEVEFDEAVSELIQAIDLFTSLPDRFITTFGESGWIPTEDLSIPLMERALQINSVHGLEKAEDFLCDSFDDNYFAIHSHRMNALWVWKDSGRERLLKLAYEDHKHGRYHASIPVVLAQIDGLSIDIQSKSFFESNNKALKINSRIATNENGLYAQAKKSNMSINETRSFAIDYPYRNGILHGRELAYDTRKVSTKSLFLLFALRPWGLLCQQNELAKQQREPYIDIKGFTPGKALIQKISELITS